MFTGVRFQNDCKLFGVLASVLVCLPAFTLPPFCCHCCCHCFPVAAALLFALCCVAPLTESENIPILDHILLNTAKVMQNYCFAYVFRLGDVAVHPLRNLNTFQFLTNLQQNMKKCLRTIVFAYIFRLGDVGATFHVLWY